MPTKAKTAAKTDTARDRKRLAVFCDGTWNDTRMPHLTNVARLAKCVEPRGWDGRRQVVFYDTGVGVATGVSPFVDQMVSLLGGLMGSGLDDKIESAYRFLVLNYEPGDEVFVFGFSRGAYTARSLCGLIRKCGILRRDCFHLIPKAMAIYRDKAAAPARLRDFRAQYSHHDPETGRPIATGEEDWQGARAWADRALEFKPRRSKTGFEWLPPDPPPLGIYRLMYLGLWDTVGSMGIPPTIPILSRLVNRRFDFYDPDASSLLFSIRQAAALDEDRKSFDLTVVRNVDDLNATWAAAHGRQVADPALPDYVSYDDRPFQQRWFPGNHSAVGGGGPESRLSSGTLVWVAVGALRAGLKLNWSADSELGAALRDRMPFAPWRYRKSGGRQQPWEFDFVGFLTGYHDRKGPKVWDEVQWAAQERVRLSPEYRPAALEPLTHEREPTPRHRAVARALMGVLWAAALGGVAFALRRYLAGLAEALHMPS
ncbi:DUF2235 domain-containing protein [Phenylobacterium sp.]|uniref:phospholipase effector Tle1 domain-containing protein n=1 Tax=Phenylobacterium sp. TaxID=1871053 RepID=UPI0025F10DC1|nr:DUF2235 domain-containing protein [Phenylobacterium sp.]